MRDFNPFLEDEMQEGERCKCRKAGKLAETHREEIQREESRAAPKLHLVSEVPQASGL